MRTRAGTILDIYALELSQRVKTQQRGSLSDLGNIASRAASQTPRGLSKPYLTQSDCYSLVATLKIEKNPFSRLRQANSG